MIGGRSSSARKEAWKERIREAARSEMPEGHFASAEPMSVTIFYFSDAPVNFDIDNIVKPILDALSQCIFIDDGQVEHLEVRKFEPERAFTFAAPSPKLADAIGRDEPRVYLRVTVSAAGEIR